jgi:hypothetical protein
VQQLVNAACQQASHLDLLEPDVNASNIVTKTGEHKDLKAEHKNSQTLRL